MRAITLMLTCTLMLLFHTRSRAWAHAHAHVLAQAYARPLAPLHFCFLKPLCASSCSCSRAYPCSLKRSLTIKSFYAQRHHARVFELHLFSSSLKPSCAQAPHAHAHAHKHALSRQRSGAFLHVRCATTELMLMPHPYPSASSILTLVSTSTIYDCTSHVSMLPASGLEKFG
jgi:hypothetical protein